jgi:pectin methylesterase-like acyl-CoA thioesterase
MEGGHPVRRFITVAVIAVAALSGIASQGRAATTDSAIPTGPTGGPGACVDAPLRLTFPAPPALGTSGTITVRQADGQLADEIDLADPASYKETIGGATDTSGKLHEFSYYPVIISGDTAEIYLHHELGYGQAYTVTVSPGVFTRFAGTSWQYTTRSRPPRPGSRVLTVDADGRGDFCSVQGAIEYMPANNTRPVTIDVHPGVYNEINWVAPGKPHITVHGESRARTIIQYANNNNLNGQTSGSICPRQLIPGHDDYNCWRANFNVEANDFTLSDITLHNTTPFLGSQAEAFRGNAQRITLDHVTLLSYQDTLRLQGLGYVTHSYIQGDVDFIWGFGTVMITDSTLESMHAGYVAQIRNDATHHGYVFVHDRLTHAPGVAPGSVYLARIDPTVFPYSQVVYIGTAMGSQISPAGWLLNNATCAQATNIQFWEYGSTTLNGTPIDPGSRLPCSSQLTAAQARLWSSPAFVLDGWRPQA